MAMTQGYQRVIDLGPEMELRLQRADGKVEWAKVREHLTIGRSAASEVVIEDAEVNLIHARVVPGVGGRPELRCVGMARLRLGDGSSVDRLDLAPGVSFRLGGVEVECVRVGKPVGFVETQTGQPIDGPQPKGMMPWQAEAAVTTAAASSVVKAEPGRGSGDSAVEAPPPAVEMPRLVVCPTCYRDMSGVPVVARFCPKCGAQLPARDAKGFLIPPEESSPLYPVYQALRDDLEGKLSDATPQVASSLIILAYANAMLNLGWRYEHGQGALRNVAEAARCYAKAGKLAEAWGK
jgi:hypothetical protein